VSTSPGGTATTVDLLSSLERFVTRRHDALNSCQRTVLCHNDFIDETFWSPPPVTPSSPVSSTLNPHPSTIPWLTSPKHFSMPVDFRPRAARSHDLSLSFVVGRACLRALQRPVVTSRSGA
jgi:hypothetical protein